MKFRTVARRTPSRPRRAAWRVARLLAGAALVAAAVVPIRALAGPAAQGLPLRLEISPSLVRPEQGHAWIVALPAEWAPFSSDLKNLDRSRLRLTENGTRLGPGNAAHAEIREDGKGVYSHWQTALYFSTSDNSDPRRNGRIYVVEIPAGDD